MILVLSYRMTEVAKSMRLTLVKPARGKGDNIELQDDSRLATLVLPLIKYDHFTERRKRKKMHWGREGEPRTGQKEMNIKTNGCIKQGLFVNAFVDKVNFKAYVTHLHLKIEKKKKKTKEL